MTRVSLVGLDRWGYRSLAGPLLRGWALRDARLAGRVRFDLHDFPHDAPVESVARALAAARPDVAGFSCFVWNVGLVRSVAARLKALRPGARVVLGGPQAAATATALLSECPAVDFVACGEGEVTFHALLRWLALGEGGPAQVPGLAYREGAALRRTAPAPLVSLEEAPAVYALGGGPAGEQSLLETSRGCPFTCSFCDWGPRKMRYLPLERIEAELRALAPRTSYIFLCDADILMEKKRGVAILEAFSRAARGHDCTLHFETNPVFLWDEAIDVIAREPAKFQPAFGVQTVNPKAHEAVRRQLDLARVERALERLRRKAPSARYGLSLIFGLPGDDLQGFRATLDWALRWHAGHFCAGQLMMIPGADVHEQKLEFKIRHQAEPPYQAYETAAMPEADMRRARELSIHAGVMLSFAPLVERLFPRESTRALPPGAAVERLEAWIAFLNERGVDVSSGLPAFQVDEYRTDERILMASNALRADKLALAAFFHAAERFSGGKAPPRAPLPA